VGHDGFNELKQAGLKYPMLIYIKGRLCFPPALSPKDLGTARLTLRIQSMEYSSMRDIFSYGFLFRGVIILNSDIKVFPKPDTKLYIH
jgi:hypothetical protein